MEDKESPYECRCAFNESICEMHRRFHEMMAEAGRAGQQILPVIRGVGIPVDVREIEGEVVVVADLPGMKSSDVTIRLTSPETLRITARRREVPEEAGEGYVIRERVSGEMTRTVNLPADVTDEGASAAFRNGVLTVRLKKVSGEEGIEIPIGEED
ncbi:hypothetical protein ABH15_09515 [Methanoculleus taiwanensis]|uniref:SHSP domain-containing protein n=2 Tax=Methanoculleus taiwanensis TaxID=1550565 RepID=A0A498H169_9EURY|nr:hypothetical protein ABH15_09515 [Methanoculleus taiwanensis]